MALHLDIPTVNYHFPSPEAFLRSLHAPLNIRSVLDVGTGHGGVFDYGFWNAQPLERRAACDLIYVRPMSPSWQVDVGVDVCALSQHYDAKSFDLVQCTETLEHIPQVQHEQAITELCWAARKMVFITSADETQHRGPEQEASERTNSHLRYIEQPSPHLLIRLGFETRVIEQNQRHIVAWRIL